MRSSVSRSGSSAIEAVGREALRLLRRDECVRLEEIRRASKLSETTVKRALRWLRSRGAKISYVGAQRGYHLNNRSFSLPLLEPSLEDLQAVLTAAGLLQELGQEAIAKRAWGLYRELAERLDAGAESSLRNDALRVTQRGASLREPRWVLDLLRAVGQEVVRLEYRSPWTNEANTHPFEPWQVWLHDGVFYVRGYSRLRKAARTFRLANVMSLRRQPGERPTRPIPNEPWGTDDPRSGVDEDRPGSAVIRLRGAVARWLQGTRWHPQQEDRWLEDDEVLERRVPYRSVREFARSILGYVDGLDAVEPVELRETLIAMAREGVSRLTR